MQHIEIIGYPCGWGAPHHGCSKGPATMAGFNLNDALTSKYTTASWAPIYQTSLSSPPLTNVRDLVLDYAAHLKQQVTQAVLSHHLPLTIGGDHSMAIASWSAIAEALQCHGRLGMIWVDAHMDGHNFRTSHSGAYHGMPLGYLLNYGTDELATLIGKKGSIFDPKHVVLIGVRSFEAEEYMLLKEKGVKIFFMEEIRSRGITTIMKEAVSIASTDTQGFGISIDLDAFDPIDAPGIGSPEIDGLRKDSFLQCLYGIGYHPRLKGLEIAEFNPEKDRNNITAQLILDIVISCFPKTGFDFSI
jgi:arginase